MMKFKQIFYLLLSLPLFFIIQNSLIWGVGKGEEEKRGAKRAFEQISEIERPTIASLFFQAVEQDDMDQLTFLAEHLNMPYVVNTIRDDEGSTLLLEAVNKGHLPIVNFMLARGANPNTADKEGITPLMAAVAQNNGEIVQRLLAIANLNLNIQDAKGLTPFHLAAGRQYEEPFAFFLAPAIIARLDVNMPDNRGNTPLMRLVDANNKLMIRELLLQPTVRVDASNGNGATALTIASRKGFTEAARYLLEYGANPNLADNGKYPLDFALENAHDDIVRLLLEKGANVNMRQANGNTKIIEILNKSAAHHEATKN